MAIKRRSFYKGLRLSPTTDALSIEGEVSVNSSDNKLKIQLNSATRSVVTEDQSQTVTNKTIDADNNTISNLEVDNLKSGVLDTDLSAVSGAHDTLPSAKAVKDYVDGQIDTIDQAIEISYDNTSSGLVAVNVQAAIDEVDVDVDDLNTLSGVAKNSTNLGTFTGSTIPDSQNTKQALQALETAHEEVDQNANDLITLSGVAENATNLGTFTGSTIADSSTIKSALQSLETSLEEIDQNANDLITLSGVAENAQHLGTFTGTTIADSSTIKAALQALETEVESKLDSGAIPATSIADGSVTDTEFQYINTLTSNAQTQLNSKASSTDLTNHTGASTGVHGVTGSVVGTTDSQSLSNKTVTASKLGGGTASATNKTLVSKESYSNLNALAREESSVYYATDAKKLYVDDGSSLIAVGTGSGGGINHIDNPDFEVNATGYSAYADAAGTSPVDGTGGSPVTTIVRSTSSPLRDTASGLWSKSAANRQGEGFSYAFTIDTADQAKMLEISYDYTVTANYVDADMRMFIYDVTNSVIIESSQRDILANSGQATYRGYFQAPSNSTSYRVIWHVASTSALAYDLKIDNVKVGPIAVGNAGTFISDWQSFTPTGSFTTNTTYSGKYRRNGDSIDLDVYVTFTGAPNSVSFTLNAPTGITLDLAKLASGNNNLQPVGDATFRDASTDTYSGFVYVAGSTSFSINKDDGDGTSSAVTQAAPFTFGSTDYISLCIRGVPVVGWSTGVSASEISSNSVISTRSRLTGNQTVSSTTETKIQFVANTTGAYDTGGSYDNAQYRFVAPESGIYNVSCNALYSSTDTGFFYLNLYKSGVYYVGAADYGTASFRSLSVPTQVQLNKGDYLEFFADSSTDSSYTISSLDSSFEVSKINNPAQIAPTEFVGCSYTTNAGLSVANNTSTNVVFEDKVFDSHGTMNTTTGLYTIPVSGKYMIHVRIIFDPSTGWASGERVAAYLYKNTSTELSRTSYYMPDTAGGSIFAASIPLSYLGDFVKGDTIEYEILQNSGAAILLHADGSMNQISIHKVG